MPEKLWSLNEMERTGGEPDVVGQDKKSGEYIFFDCSEQTPEGRVSLCYDREALDSRKEHKPKNSVMDMAAAMGIEVLTEEQYLELQKLGEFDTKSSSWIKTPADIRKLGGALYCDRRYGRVFVGHNGAESYYSGRGFRGWLKGLNFDFSTGGNRRNQKSIQFRTVCTPGTRYEFAPGRINLLTPSDTFISSN